MVKKKNLIYITIFGTFLGAGLALISTKHSLEIQSGILRDYPLCMLNSVIDCRFVYASVYASIADVPIAWIGFLYYFWVSSILLWMIIAKKEIHPFILGAYYVSLCALLFCIYNTAVMIFELQKFCIICITMSLLILAITLLLKNYLELSIRNTLMKLRLLIQVIFFKGAEYKQVAVSFFSFLIVFLTGTAIMATMKTNDFQADGIKMPEVLLEHFSQPPRNIELDSLIPLLGSPRADVEIIVVSDFQCPFCKEAAFYVDLLFSEFKDKIKVRFLNYPLDKKVNPYVSLESHQLAGAAARAAICANQYTGFWQYHRDLFLQQDEISDELFSKLAEKHDWSSAEFLKCMNSKETSDELTRQIEIVNQLKVNGTPTIFVNGRSVKYWYQPTIFRAIILSELKKSNTSSFE